MRGYALFAVSVCLGLTGLVGCGSSRQPTVAAAPPVTQAPSMPAPPVGQAPAGGVYDWRDVPVNERVPVMRAVFDQAGYQIFANSGETIVVPFVNQNLYVMRFGRSDNGGLYFVNEGSAPTLYLPMNGYLENAVAQGARWYPLPQDHAYTRPVYVGIAPSWTDYRAMGWYPGMMTYGGMWGYSPTAHFAWMPSFYVNIGGTRYNDYVSYRTYYTNHRGYVPNRVVYRNYTPPRRTVTGFGGSSGSFGSSRSTGSFGRGSGGSGSFGSARSSGSGSFGTGRTSGGFGSSGSTFGSGARSSGFGSSSGGFGSNRSSGFGSSGGSSSGRTGSFGSSSGFSGRSTGSSSSSFGRSSSSSFGSGSGSNYTNSGRSTGSSFGGPRSTGSSSGSFGRSSGSSFGSGSSSSGRSNSSSSFGRSSGSFGRRR
jgi:hypothetical protein